MNKAELKAAIAEEKKRHAEVIKGLESKLRVIEMEESARSRDAYAKKKAMLEKSGEWLQTRLKPGDWVQVTGSRAGKYREVIAVNYGAIIGAVLHQQRVRTPEGIKTVMRKSALRVTEQGLNKITHVYRNGEFIGVDVLMVAAEMAKDD